MKQFGPQGEKAARWACWVGDVAVRFEPWVGSGEPNRFRGSI